MSDGIVIRCQPFLSPASICSFIYRALHRPGLTSAMGKHVALVMTVCMCACVLVGVHLSQQGSLELLLKVEWFFFPVSRAWSCFSVDLRAEHWDHGWIKEREGYYACVFVCVGVGVCVWWVHVTETTPQSPVNVAAINETHVARCVRGEREREHRLHPQVSVHDSKHSTVLYVNVPSVPHTPSSAHSWLAW